MVRPEGDVAGVEEESFGDEGEEIVGGHGFVLPPGMMTTVMIIIDRRQTFTSNNTSNRYLHP